MGFFYRRITWFFTGTGLGCHAIVGNAWLYKQASFTSVVPLQRIAQGQPSPLYPDGLPGVHHDFFTAQGARQGDDILAANAILMQLLLLVSYVQDGFARAEESLTGHAVGTNDLDNFYHICKEVTLWGLGISCAATAAYLLFPSAIITIFTDFPEIITATQHYWPWLTTLPLAGCSALRLMVFLSAPAKRVRCRTLCC